MDDEEEQRRRRAQFEVEKQFIRERGGKRWIDTYVNPSYRDWTSYAPAQPWVVPLIPAVRDRARELSAADISQMVRMHWRIQVMGTWYAIARADETFAQPLHDAFDFCYGSLTAPGLTAAVLTYRTRDDDAGRRSGPAGRADRCPAR